MSKHKYILLTFEQALTLYKDVPLWWQDGGHYFNRSVSFCPEGGHPEDFLHCEWARVGPYYLQVKDEEEVSV